METAGGYDLNAHYAAELRQARRTLQDDGADFAAGILEDGVITKSELAELNDHMLQCLGDLGHDTDSITMGELGGDKRAAAQRGVPGGVGGVGWHVQSGCEDLLDARRGTDHMAAGQCRRDQSGQ